MKQHRLTLKKQALSGMVALSLLLCSAHTTFAADETFSEPVGFNTFNCLANSDTIIGIGFHRPSVFQGRVNTFNGTALKVEFAETAPFVANQFVFNSTLQTNTYYVLLTSGQKVGAWVAVTANTVDTLTLDSTGIDLAGVAAGDTFKVIPFWTLATLFPEGGGLPTNLGFSPANSEVQLPQSYIPGINLGILYRYYYYSGAAVGGPGWRRAGGGLSIVDNQIIVPDTYLVARNLTANSAPLVVSGAVQMSAVRTSLATLADGVAQDSSLSIATPVEISLAETGFYQSGAFKGNNGFSPVDELQVFDNTQPGMNKAVAKRYYYYTGAAAGGPGWRLAGGGLSLRDTETIPAGGAIIIRKKATSTAQSLDATTLLRYHQQ